MTEQDQINKSSQRFLDDTDWKILRHIREQTLSITTTLTQEEIETLEQERQDKAASIVR